MIVTFYLLFRFRRNPFLPRQPTNLASKLLLVYVTDIIKEDSGSPISNSCGTSTDQHLEGSDTDTDTETSHNQRISNLQPSSTSITSFESRANTMIDDDQGDSIHRSTRIMDNSVDTSGSPYTSDPSPIPRSVQTSQTSFQLPKSSGLLVISASTAVDAEMQTAGISRTIANNSISTSQRCWSFLRRGEGAPKGDSRGELGRDWLNFIEDDGPRQCALGSFLGRDGKNHKLGIGKHDSGITTYTLSKKLQEHIDRENTHDLLREIDR